MVPLLGINKKNKQEITIAGVSLKGAASTNSEPIDDSLLLGDLSDTAIHELFHLLRIEHPFETTQAEDTKLIHSGGNNYATGNTTDPNIFYNIMNYDSTIINNILLKDLWKKNRPEYITKGQIDYIIKEIDLQMKGGGIYNDDMAEFDSYWIFDVPGIPVKKMIK